jgi:hypothetical protein
VVLSRWPRDGCRYFKGMSSARSLTAVLLTVAVLVYLFTDIFVFKAIFL